MIDWFKRYATLKTHHIYSLPIVILMPHSQCNCRCVMCDIWKGDTAQHLTEADLGGLLDALKRWHTRRVVLSGGEALLNPRVFGLCEMLQTAGMRVTILSTGLLLSRYAAEVVRHSDAVIVSLDGSEPVHDAIRRIPNAYQKLARGVESVKAIKPDFPVSARCVIQRGNFADWPHIIDAAHALDLDGISFLPADVSSTAFNHPADWSDENGIVPTRAELPQLHAVIETLIRTHANDFTAGYIAESPMKMRRIYAYYAAIHGLGAFPLVRCNAPSVSTVIEADGTVRPCFFHAAMGNIHTDSLPDILNAPAARAFRRTLDTAQDPICQKCVCSLYLGSRQKI